MTEAAKTYTPEKLLEFEETVKDAFLSGTVLGPVHLSGGNEQECIDIFQKVTEKDWVFSTWRSHYHALLKGIPSSFVYDEICAGRSMMIHSREHKFLTSAIVGGILPIALGTALGIKWRGSSEKVWVFIGDMTERTGIFSEFSQYAIGHQLPINVVVEDNGLSTNSPTQEVWGSETNADGKVGFHRYSYKRTVPHVGVGEWVTFS